MGVVNVTADSFSDGGLFLETTRAIDHGLRLREEGADLVDVGGESTRPGALPVPLDEELRRVIPVVEALVRENVPVSVDTLKPEVMRAALDAGCAMVNDVNGFRAPGAIEAVAASKAAVCAMHMQGKPATMQADPRYGDVLAEVAAFLSERALALEAAGVARESIVLDPGFGFGKTLEHNLALFRGLPRLAALGYPVLVGVSRKRLIGDLTGRPVAERVAGSVAAALLAVQNGASLVRVHDVKETVDALRVWLGLNCPIAPPKK
ncbi:dihydropteroate synthase [Usitatibacter palustris]|uniref:dihydropteroate synthase n=1 Tax=Usitatibacter palustris TaxID=2732487 RepID=A0A6M4HB71_9PROT|nr:dihydropteroate synthase [Usitatibacter palustris]QJR16098.1 Dihydropteroate synthase [Usitatibacter palustris]